MRPVLVYIPEGLIKELDELVRAGLYPNRNAVIREAIRDLIEQERVMRRK